MPISYKYEVENNLLKVLTHGTDDDLQSVENYAREILVLAITNNCSKVLCDERQLEYSLSGIDTYQLAEAASKEARNLKKIAIVCDIKYLEDGKFFETVSHNRGLVILVTTNYAKAIEWLD